MHCVGGGLQSGLLRHFRGPAPLDRVFLSTRLLSGNTGQGPTGKEFLVCAPPMRRKDGKSRRLFVKLAEPADDLVRKSHIIVPVLQDQRFPASPPEAAFVINASPNVN